MNLSSESMLAATLAAFFPWETSALKATSLLDFTPVSGVVLGVAYVSQKSVLAKIAFASLNARDREDGSERSALTTSAPREANLCEAVEDGLRVTHRTCQLGRLRKVWATEDPWFPVAPMTAIIFLLDETILKLETGVKEECESPQFKEI